VLSIKVIIGNDLKRQLKSTNNRIGEAVETPNYRTVETTLELVLTTNCQFSKMEFSAVRFVAGLVAMRGNALTAKLYFEEGIDLRVQIIDLKYDVIIGVSFTAKG
jgi:hypothetical protein